MAGALGVSRVGIKLHVDVREAAKLQAAMAGSYAVINGGAAIAQAALTAVGAAFVAMGAGAFVALGATSQFQNEMTTLRALSGITREEMYALYGTINDVATAFGVSGDEIAAGAVTLSKAGLTIDEINQSISAMTMLARANGIAFEQAANITVFAVETFNREFSESVEMMDAMQVAAQESILNIEDLQKAFAYAGSTAQMTGVGFEQLISLMAVLSNRAMVAGISSRSLNKMFIDMLQHTDELNQFMASMGMTFDIIKDGKLDVDALIAAFGDEQMSIELLMGATDIFTVRALRAFGLLIGASDDYAIMLDKVNNSSGALVDVAGIMMESFSVQFSRVKEEFLAMLRTEEVVKALTVFVGQLTTMMRDLKPEIMNLVVSALGQFTEMMASGIFQGALKAVVGLISLMFKSLSTLYSWITLGNRLNVKWLMGLVLLKVALGDMVVILYTYATASNVAMTAGQLMNATVTAGIFGIMMLAHHGSIWVKILGALSIAMAAYTAYKWANVAATWALVEAQAFLAGVQGVGLMTSGQLAGIAAAGVGAGVLAAGAVIIGGTALAVSAYRSQKKESQRTAAMLEGIPSADTGMFYSGSSIYDTGGLSPRHQLAYIEPGEQIVSKTQGMVGMGGGGVNVYVGDVYAQDGTDFADKLAAALPRALRKASNGGGF